jgi:dihydrolipoamide dehydrogenase
MQYDLITIGAGPGGYEAALKAAKAGMKVLLIDKAEAGGTCLNRGCIPTKALLHSAKLFYETAHAAEIGITAENLSYDLAKIYENKNAIVKKLNDGLMFLFKQHKIDYINARAQILDKDTVLAAGEKYSAKFILIATGSAPFLPPVKGIDSKNVFTSDDVLNAPPNFDSVCIIGGGVIGAEFASFYNYLGKKVCIAEAADRLLANMDKEISQNLSMVFKKRGVSVHTSAAVLEITDGGCRFSERGEEKEINAQAVIIAAGRKPYTDGLFADGFTVNRSGGKGGAGFIEINKHFQRSVANVYAIGDVTGGTMLAHAASAQGEAAVGHMLAKESKKALNVIPACVYTSPEIACAGLTADEAANLGINAKTAKYVMLANGKSMIEREERGFVKLVFNEQNKIIGGHLMCGRASDLIALISFAIANSLSLEEFEKTILPHPTFCEGIGEAVKSL